jgi:hypothetical protein
MPQQTTSEISPRSVERNLERAGRMLGTLSRSPEIRRILAERAGYTEEDHRNGWSLYLTAMGFRQAPPSSATPAARVSQQMAIAGLDQWDAPAFERAHAALAAAYPSQRAYIFNGLRASTGVGAVAGVKTFLDRVAVLRNGSDPARAATRDADRAAADLLARRRIVHADVEAGLRKLIDQATSMPEAKEDPPIEDSADFRAAAIGLRAWLTDWRAQARTLIRRRDHLISLGLAERKAAPKPKTAARRSRRRSPRGTGVHAPLVDRGNDCGGSGPGLPAVRRSGPVDGLEAREGTKVLGVGGDQGEASGDGNGGNLAVHERRGLARLLEARSLAPVPVSRDFVVGQDGKGASDDGVKVLFQRRTTFACRKTARAKDELVPHGRRDGAQGAMLLQLLDDAGVRLPHDGRRDDAGIEEELHKRTRRPGAWSLVESTASGSRPISSSA